MSKEPGKQSSTTYQQVAGNIAPESAGAEQKTFGVLDLFQIQRRANTPFHEFKIEVDRLVCQPVCDAKIRCQYLKTAVLLEKHQLYLVGSIYSVRLTILPANFPAGLRSQPVILGI